MGCSNKESALIAKRALNRIRKISCGNVCLRSADDLVASEPLGDLDLGVFRAVRAMHGVFAHGESELLANGALGSVRRVGRTHHFAVLQNGVLAFQNLYDNRGRRHLRGEFAVEGALLVHGVEGLRLGERHVHALLRHDAQPAASMTALIAPVRLRRVASGLMIEKVCSTAMGRVLHAGSKGKLRGYSRSSAAKASPRVAMSTSVLRRDAAHFTLWRSEFESPMRAGRRLPCRRNLHPAHIRVRSLVLAEYDREVAEACFKASGFKDPEAGSTVMLFDDSVGHDALIVSGTYPQAHMNNAKGEMLCLFNKATRTASVSEVMKPE